MEISNLTYDVVGYIIIIPSICIFGIVGNIITLFVLIRGRIQGIAYSYMKAVAILDLLSLTFILPIFTRCRTCDFASSSFGTIFEAYLFISVGDIFTKASVWTVIVFTVERCLGICFDRSAIKIPRNQQHSVLVSVIVVTTAAAVENIPTFWYHRLENGKVVRTEVAECSMFFIVYRWVDATLAYVIPFLLMVIFNIILVRFLIKREQRQASMRHLGSFAKSRRFKEQTRVVSTIVGILVMFFVTVMPCFTLQLMAQYAHFTSDIFNTFRITVSILMSLNCSGNFILYCVLNRRFRSAFRKTLVSPCCGRADLRNIQIHPRRLPAIREDTRPREDGVPDLSPGLTTPRQVDKFDVFVTEKWTMSDGANNSSNTMSRLNVQPMSKIPSSSKRGDSEALAVHSPQMTHNVMSDADKMSTKKVVSFIDGETLETPIFTIASSDRDEAMENLPGLSPGFQETGTSELSSLSCEQIPQSPCTQPLTTCKGAVFKYDIEVDL